jgi:hypothetical protein
MSVCVVEKGFEVESVCVCGGVMTVCVVEKGFEDESCGEYWGES